MKDRLRLLGYLLFSEFSSMDRQGKCNRNGLLSLPVQPQPLGSGIDDFGFCRNLLLEVQTGVFITRNNRGNSAWNLIAALSALCLFIDAAWSNETTSGSGLQFGDQWRMRSFRLWPALNHVPAIRTSTEQGILPENLRKMEPQGSRFFDANDNIMILSCCKLYLRLHVLGRADFSTL
jgi:hypothetical protein